MCFMIQPQRRSLPSEVDVVEHPDMAHGHGHGIDQLLGSPHSSHAHRLERSCCAYNAALAGLLCKRGSGDLTHPGRSSRNRGNMVVDAITVTAVTDRATSQ